MSKRFKPLLERDVLQRELHYEFEAFKASAEERALKERLKDWSRRTVTGETEIEAAFIGRFFEETWGYHPAGGSRDHHTLQQQFGVVGAGAGGGSGSADLALGRFGEGGTDIPQVLCEFKGVAADLDRPQARKGSRRSAAEQALDYLRHARRGMFGNEAVLPRFALVTNMNIFRLYWYDKAPDHYIQFRIEGGDLLGPLDTLSLEGDAEDKRFNRFLFWRLLQPDMLLSEFGRTRLERLIERQGVIQRKLEKAFYEEYRQYRLRLFNIIRLQPLDDVPPRERLRLAQKLLDRFIFIMFAEDMGQRVAFPPNLLREQLKRESLDPFYDPDGTDIWRKIRRIFRLMNEGGELDGSTVHQFNGGLFEDDPLIERLELPNHLFCKGGQGRNDATIESEKETLLYLSARYNFAAEGNAENSIGLYTLGHIFEQSIVELEALEGEAEQRLSLAEVTKRKRDGVYYTPEAVVRRIVEETVGPLLARWKAEAGWPEIEPPSREAADAYWERLTNIRLVDPACGSGAFLIVAHQYLLAAFHEASDRRYELRYDIQRRDESELARMILTNNIFGVDINPLSVEITQLSLWLHTVRPREPLSAFRDTIKVGNSLVGSRLFDKYPDAEISQAARDRIAVFDWESEFPTIFEDGGGFDVVVGNPPYVKLQHFRKVYAETAEYLREGVGGESDYHSTATGNFDLYLPFIEKGLALLNEGGRMGYIAPNLWPKLKYGEGLRKLVRESRNLERWIDFRSHQVFEEATIYTAIQIFSAAPNDAIAIAFAGEGDLAQVDWDRPDAIIPYTELPEDGEEWLFAPGPIRAMIGRLWDTCPRLDNDRVTSSIFQGLVTSADYVFHLKRLGRNRYLHQPKAKDEEPFEVAIEDAIMKPLVSGPQAKRFIAPETEIFLLFPYHVDNTDARIFTPAEMERQYPLAWSYLDRFEQDLRKRDSRKNDDDLTWFGYIYPKSLDKQEQPKLFVAQTVPEMRVCYDIAGEFYANNVRVNGIVPREASDGWYLLGCLNAPVTNSMFRWIAKPKDNKYFEANKQFIAPLPIPDASGEDREALSRIAEGLQANYTERARLRTALEGRLGQVSRRAKPHEWLLPAIRAKSDLDEEAPPRMPRAEKREWVNREYKDRIDAALARIDDLIRVDSRFEARFTDGELVFEADEIVLCNGVYADEETGRFLLAQWQAVALDYEPTGKGDAKRLIDALRKVGTEAPEALKNQIIERQERLSEIGANLVRLEAELHEMTCRLFALTPAERQLVEARV